MISIVDDDWQEQPDDLTVAQRAAVEHFEGPLLVVAGPGSGKTRVITRRIARLIERGVKPWEILAITFTNKAAKEMAERVQALIPGTRVWVSTFHRFCARLLREYGRAIGIDANFSIFDTQDQSQLLRQVLKDLDFDSTHFPPAKIASRISRAKNNLLTPERYLEKYGEGIGTHLEAVVAKVYPEYQQKLLTANGVDFDDLLMHVTILLAENEEIRTGLDERYRFILVDEYQDTNQAQYEIVASLSQIEQNLCATGDPDQSIYGWRGAQIENILRFERDFPKTKLLRLEENFRSTPEILLTADNLIAHNVQRKEKKLIGVNPNGEPVELRLHLNGIDEAQFIVNEIMAMVEAGERQWKDFAIFYRVNSLSRTLETTLSRLRIPYQVAGGVAFYERAEVKDLVGYLRLVSNPKDRAAFLRIVNCPARGIGKTSVDRLVRWADLSQTSFLEAARQARQVPNIPKKSAGCLCNFATLMDELSQLADGPVERLLKEVLARTGYQNLYSDSDDEDDSQRLSNIDELVSAARLYDEHQQSTGEESTLTGFLETTSLVQDLDSLDQSTGAVTLMTLHSAKGLEFPVVYIVAVEQGLIPHERSINENDPRSFEEERRLLFVGVTRAKEKLVLTHTTYRERHGQSLTTIPSDFLLELVADRRDFTTIDSFEFGEPEFASTDDDDFGSDEYHEEDVDFIKVRKSESTFRSPKKPVFERRDLKLTTAAALESGLERQVEIPIGFAIGSEVRHPRYGLGIVIESSGFAKNRTVTVEFESDRRRETFVVAKCPLQPVGLK